MICHECWFRQVLASMIDLGSGLIEKERKRKGKEEKGKEKQRKRKEKGKEKQRKRKGKGKNKKRKRVRGLHFFSSLLHDLWLFPIIIPSSNLPHSYGNHGPFTVFRWSILIEHCKFPVQIVNLDEFGREYPHYRSIIDPSNSQYLFVYRWFLHVS